MQKRPSNARSYDLRAIEGAERLADKVRMPAMQLMAGGAVTGTIGFTVLVGSAFAWPNPEPQAYETFNAYQAVADQRAIYREGAREAATDILQAGCMELGVAIAAYVVGHYISRKARMSISLKVLK